MEELTISEVAKRAGIRASAIRYYESIQLLPSPQRSAGRRRYNPDVLRRISFIQVAQAAGLTIAEIQTLINELDDADPCAPEAGRDGCIDAQGTGYEDDSGKWSELSLLKFRRMHRLHHSCGN